MGEIALEVVTRRYKAIRGIRLHVTRMEAKFKLGQDEPFRARLAVADGLEAQGVAADRELAARIRKQNESRCKSATTTQALG